jgi:hypothetical protein
MREAAPRRRSCRSWPAAAGATSQSRPDRRRGFRFLPAPARDEARSRPALLPEWRRLQRTSLFARTPCASVPKTALAGQQRPRLVQNASPEPGDTDVTSQIERLSSKEMKMAARSVRIVVGASARSATLGMVVSRVGGLATSLCQSVGCYPPPHRIFPVFWATDQAASRLRAN